MLGKSIYTCHALGYHSPYTRTGQPPSKRTFLQQYRQAIYVHLLQASLSRTKIPSQLRFIAPAAVATGE